MTNEEMRFYKQGQESILAELWNEISLLEERVSTKTSYGKGQLVILKKIVEVMDLKEKE